jgi:hypothetical protein
LVAHVRTFVSCLAVAALLAGQIAVQTAPAFAAPLSKAAYEACQARDEQGFRTAVAAITSEALRKGIATIDYRAVVGDAWRRNGVGDIVDKEVDAAVDQVVKETSWSNLLQSLANQQKAQELATAVAERVYRSDAMKAALQQLSVDVGRDVGKQIELASQDAAEPTLDCLRAFVGTRYGATVARAVSGEAGKEVSVNTDQAAAGLGPGSVLTESSGAIAGAMVLVMRRQLANMAERVGARLVGSALARIVSVAAGGVGLVLIAKDIWDFRHGVMPIIATEMKSQENKQKVQDELAAAFKQQISEHVDEIGAATADKVLDVWRSFRNAHAAALDLAERNAQFKAFLDSLQPQSLPRLDEVVAIVLASEGEPGLLKRLGDGTLNTAVNALPAPAMEIAHQARSIDAGLRWSALAGSDLPKVVDIGLYRVTSPDKLTQASLRRMLALDDRVATVRLAGLEPGARDMLFELNDDDLKRIAQRLTETELTTLSSYLTGLQKGPREEVLRAIAADPARMQVLAPDRVRVAVVASADQTAAVAMMLRSGGLDAGAILADLQLVTDGRVSPVLLWEKHPALIIAAAFAALILLLMLHRLLFARRHPRAA